jgi:hypothetical protein
MNIKAQLEHPILSFFVLAIILLMLSPIMLKVFISIRDPLSSSLGNLSSGGDIAKTNFEKVINTGINLWDKVIIFCFFIALVLLFVSAYLIDSHPIFLVLYIFVAFLLILLAPSIIGALDNIYNSSEFVTEVSYLPYVEWLKNNFIGFLIGVIVITGIIIYGKIALTGGNSRS